jgi:hypothetical protein
MTATRRPPDPETATHGDHHRLGDPRKAGNATWLGRQRRGLRSRAQA